MRGEGGGERSGPTTGPAVPSSRSRIVRLRLKQATTKGGCFACSGAASQHAAWTSFVNVSVAGCYIHALSRGGYKILEGKGMECSLTERSCDVIFIIISTSSFIIEVVIRNFQ